MTSGKFTGVVAMILALLTTACGDRGEQTQTAKDRAVVEQQQAQYAKGQPIPVYDHSLERDWVISLYNLRNQKVATHAVWRSDMGSIEGDCSSIGFGIPYDTSLTNPYKAEWKSWGGGSYGKASAVVSQPEPNGIFASTNTAATWVLCTDETGALLPVYVEAKVTVYPYAVLVDYETNRVIRTGDAKATL